MCSYFFIGKCIAKKWTNIKDCWMKYNRLQTNNLVSGAATTTKRKYIYYEQMRFLKKISTPADTDSSLATTESAEQDNSFVRPATSATKRKRNVVPPTDDIDKKILHILEKSDKTESPHISFFRGILPSLEQLNTDRSPKVFVACVYSFKILILIESLMAASLSQWMLQLIAQVIVAPMSEKPANLNELRERRNRSKRTKTWFPNLPTNKPKTKLMVTETFSEEEMIPQHIHVKHRR